MLASPAVSRICIYTGVRQNNGKTWKFPTNLFQYGFLIGALPWNPAFCSSLSTVFEETGYLRWSFSLAVIFGAAFLWSFLTIHVRVQRSLPDSFRFLPEFCFYEEVFPSFSSAVITFEIIFLATLNNSAVFAIRVPTIWPLLKYDRSTLLILMISVKKKDNFSQIRRKKNS